MVDFARSADPRVQAELDRLHKIGPGADVLGLDRISRLLDLLGRPQDRLPPVFHVAGTNGKGSTCAFLRAMLEAAGYRVHVFTSPHLVRFNERIRIAGKLVEDGELADLLAEVREAGTDIGPSFFEATTAAAFLAFARHPADACIIEVGLGGRLDATNVIERPLVTGIASLGIDHRQFLGDTLSEIAGEKAGIAKPGVPMVTLAYDREAEAATDARLAAANVERFKLGEHWQVAPSPTGFQFRDQHGALDLPQPGLPGDHQMLNAGLALAMLRRQTVLSVSDDAARKGIAAARWPARLQRLTSGKLVDLLPAGVEVILDGAHNRNAAEAVAKALCGGGPINIVTGILRNRGTDEVLAPFAGMAKRLLAVPLHGHDHHDPRDIIWQASEMLGVKGGSPADNVEQAFDWLAEMMAEDGVEPGERVLVVGSLYLAGAVLEANGTLPD